MPGRAYTSAGAAYRYGFNGKEKDDETYGNGNEYDYGLRIYDPRLGRFLTVDPLSPDYPWYTPYQFAGNNPIHFIDLDGGEEKKPEISTNVVIVIATETEIKDYAKLNGTNHGQWHYIISPNMVDANKQLDKYTGGQKIDNLIIDTHGSTEAGKIAVRQPTKDKAFRNVTLSNLKKYPNNSDPVVKMNLGAMKLMSKKIKDNGNCVLLSCNFADGATGDEAMKALGNIMGNKINIYGSEGFTYGTINQGNNPSMDKKLINPDYSSAAGSNSEDDGFKVNPAGSDELKEVQNITVSSKKGTPAVKINEKTKLGKR